MQSMTELELKHYLNRAFYAEKLAAALRVEVERDRSIAERISRSAEAVPGGGRRNVTEESLLRLAETERRLRESLQTIVRLREETARLIDKLPDSDMQAVLRLHFLGYESFSRIAEELNYSESTVYRRYREAIKKLTLNDSF